MKTKKIAIVLLLSLFLSLITGCDKDKKLSAFEENMTTFKDNITGISETMDAIDPQSENAVFELISCLDSMNEEFQFLAEIEVPNKFASIESLADEAATYMSEANALYHQYYDEGTTYDETVKETAEENYSRAMKRITYISELLQGKIPEDADISVTEEDALDFEPVTQEE